jgi:hypothetical protein
MACTHAPLNCSSLNKCDRPKCVPSNSRNTSECVRPYGAALGASPSGSGECLTCALLLLCVLALAPCALLLR